MISRSLCVHLEGRGIPFALIGAVALAVHGVARFTADVDLLVQNPAVLEAGFWVGFPGPSPELRRGDAEDPLVGVVRFPLEPQHDLIVGRSAGTRLALAESVPMADLPCRVASPLALLALKAEAGSPQDAHDARALLEAQALLGDLTLATRFQAILPTLDADANQFVTRFRLLDGLI